MAPGRTMIRLVAWVALAVCGLTAGAGAPLGQIQWPVVGRPAVVVPGGQLEVGLKGAGSLALEAAGVTTALEVAWVEERAGVRSGVGTVPESLAPGTYRLTLTDAAGEATAAPVVHVVPEITPDYTVALIRRPTAVAGDQPAPPIAPGLANQLTALSPQLVLAVGPFTSDGNAAELAALQDAIAAIPFPVYVCPSREDLESGLFESYFGALDYGVTYGPDGFLSLGPGLGAANADVTGRMGDIYRIRRAIRASRWSTGVAARYGLDWHTRAQLTLFVDDPLDYLVAGAVTSGAGESVPWGKAQIVPPPALPRTGLIVVEVNERGIKLRHRDIGK